MRRSFVAAMALFVAACSAAPEPMPTKTPAPSAPSIPVTEGSWIELTGALDETTLTSRDESGAPRYAVELGAVRAAIALPDGGACAVVGAESETPAAREVIRFDAHGREAWRHRVPSGGPTWTLARVRARILAFDASSESLHVLDDATGKRLSFPELEVTTHPVMPSSERATTRLTARAGDVVWSVGLRGYPSFTSASEVAWKAAAGGDGTVLVGSSDGAIVAFDAMGRQLYQLGVRGAVERVVAQADGTFAVALVDRGTLVFDADGGRSEARSRTGRVVDRRGPKAGEGRGPEPAPPWRWTTDHDVRRVEIDGRPLRGVRSLVTVGTEVWVLAQPAPAPGQLDVPRRLHRFDGRRWVDHGVPSTSFPREVFAAGGAADTGHFAAESLAVSPRGTLLVLGWRIGRLEKRAAMLERRGDTFHERRELSSVLSAIQPNWGTMSYAASPAGREVFCVGVDDECVELGPGVAPRPLAAAPRTIEGADRPSGQRGAQRKPILFAGETLWQVNGAALGEDSIWGAATDSSGRAVKIRHWNGAELVDFEVPSAVTSLWVSAPDELWLAGPEGLARFDGTRGARLLGIHPPSSWQEDLQVVPAEAGVWVFGEPGLWHVAPRPGRSSDVAGELSSWPPAAPPSVPLEVAPGAPFRLERLVVRVGEEDPLIGAIDVAAAPGVLWLRDGQRVVEVAGGRATVIYGARAPEPFVCWSAPEVDCGACADCTERRPRSVPCIGCVAPIAAGEGACFDEDGVLRFRGGADAPLHLPGLISLGASPGGDIWAVSVDRQADLPQAVVRNREGMRVVHGLPPAAYTAVAARAENDVWFAAGLVSAAAELGGRTLPGGEGWLVHFDGKAFHAYRAPDGALLSVAATAPGEAWAVGLGGGVLHVKAGAATSFRLAAETHLRRVAATGPNDVWLAGDDATLLHWNGKAMRRIDASLAGSRAPFAGLVARPGEPAVVVGPTGLWRIVPAG